MRRKPRLLSLPAVVLTAGFLMLFTGISQAAGVSHHGTRKHHKPPPPPEINLTHIPTGPTAPVIMQPIGLSIEYPVMAHDLGSGECPAPALVNELRRLGSPPLALAGASQDLTAPSGVLPAQRPSWQASTLYSLPANFWSQLHCLLTSTSDPLTAGINMKTGEPAWAAQIAAGAQSAATNGLDFSIGNEPDLYSLPNYAELSKPQGNEETTMVNMYLGLASVLDQAIGSAPLVGPELAIAARWRHQLPRVIAQLHEAAVGVHLYPLTACGSSPTASVKELLSEDSANAPRSLSWVAADANAAKVPAMLSEANSASCGGADGVSDSPASAVWAVRFVLSALKTGFRQVRFHFSGGPYDPFIVRGSEVQDRPLQYALVALNEWLPVGTTLETLTDLKGLDATAVGGNASAPTVILDNESTKAQTVVLRGQPSVHIVVFDATRSGPQVAQLSSAADSIKLTVAINSVVAIFTGPQPQS